MKREIIIIPDEVAIVVPNNPDVVRMTICEIADLFGIYYQITKRHIRAIEKSGVANGDYTMCCAVGGGAVRPEYYGLEMIIALAFRIQSRQADKFRKWLLERATQPPQPPISVIVPVKERALPN